MERTFIFSRMADSTKLENKRLYKPMLYQFCIANNEGETRFLFKAMNDAVEIQLKYTNCFPLLYHISNISADIS